jgi:hypothetical protein
MPTQTQNNASQAPPKKSNKTCFTCLLALVIFIIGCIAIIAVLRFFIPMANPASIIGDFFDRIMNNNSASIEKNIALRATSSDSNAEIITADGKTALTLVPVDKSQWPKDSIGGIYKLEPSGKFDKPITFKMTLNKAPLGPFSIGYRDEKTKKWEFLPTINLGNNQYATVLNHASNIGGGSPSACPSKFQDPENQAMSSAIRAEAMKIQIDQQTGEAAKINDASWKKAWENSDELTNKTISDFCKERKAANNFWDITNTPATMDFLNGTQMMQCLGFKTLADKYAKAMDTECGKKKKENVYIIKQTDYMDANVNANIAQGFYKQKMNSKTAAVTSGKATSPAKPGTFGWQTSWQVDTFYTSTFTSDSGVHIEGGNLGYDYYLLDIPMKGVAGGSTNVNRVTFSLEGVKEREAFSVRITPITPYTSSASGSQQTARGKIIEDGQLIWNYNQNFSPSWSVSATGKPMDFKAILVKNLGEKGAIVKFSSDLGDLGGKQGEQLKQINDLVKNAMPGGQNYHGIILPQGVTISESGADKPWIIKLESEEENVNPEDDYKTEEEQMKNSSNPPAKEINQKINPNDKDGDGVPDLVPLVPQK